MWELEGVAVTPKILKINDALNVSMDEQTISKLFVDISSEVQRRSVEKLPLRDGALELFEFASSNNIEMAICTGSTEDFIKDFLIKNKIRHFISHVVSVSMAPVELHKPHPHAYNTIIKEMNIKATDAVTVEDSIAGIQSSMSAHIPTVAIPTDKYREAALKLHPLLVVSSLTEIIDFIESTH